MWDTEPFSLCYDVVDGFRLVVDEEFIDGIRAKVGQALLFRVTGGTAGQTHDLTFTFNTVKGSFRYTSTIVISVEVDI